MIIVDLSKVVGSVNGWSQWSHGAQAIAALMNVRILSKKKKKKEKKNGQILNH